MIYFDLEEVLIFLLLFLRKSYITSGGSRNIKKITSLLHDKTPFKKLSIKQPSKAGRSRTGHLVIRTKTSLKTRFRLFRINYKWRWSELGFISTFNLVPYRNNLLSLVFFASGGVSYLPATNFSKMLDFVYFPTKSRSLRKYLPNPSFFCIHHLKPLSKVSSLELYPGAGAQYARSAGTSAKILKFNYQEFTCVVRLPSGVRKVFSLYSLAHKGHSALKDARKAASTKAGYWRMYGRKSIVRGVARNPVDHPHGGRTKSIKNPRTPWGKPTKLK